MHNATSPATGDDAVEQLIKAKGLTAPRVTPQDLSDNITECYYFTAEDGLFGSLPGPKEVVTRGGNHSVSLSLLTFCVIVLRNGFTVTGESACASPENFDAEIGREIAFENAKNKIWPLMGYALKEKLA